jgi:hypothetical protein
MQLQTAPNILTDQRTTSITLPRQPNFFIVGAPKSGTTAMHVYLSEHPDIYMADYKEPHYFGEDLLGPRMTLFRGKKKKYLSIFADARYEKWVGESSIWYLYSRTAAREIHTFDRNARILIMLRSPLEMIYSYYSQAVYTGNEVLPTFEEALAIEADRRQGRGVPPLAHSLHGLYYTAIGSYYEQVKRYLEVFPREQVHIIIYDDFRKDTPGAYRDTLAFLGVDSTFETNFPIINANKEVRSPLLQKLMMTVGISPMLLKDRLHYLTTTNRLLPHWFRHRILYSAILAYSQKEPRPTMKPETRAHLQDVFREDVERLSELLGRDLTHWCRD